MMDNPWWLDDEKAKTFHLSAMHVLRKKIKTLTGAKTMTAEKLHLEKLELRRKELDFKIIELRNRIKADEMEAEPSAAEKWFEEVGGSNLIDKYMKGSFKAWAIPAHEAGQKHGAGVERERYEPLIDKCRYIVNIMRDCEALRDLSLILKNLESPTEPEQSAELHKETQGLLQELISMINHFNGCPPTQSEFSFLQLILDMLSTRYKLTPIKD